MGSLTGKRIIVTGGASGMGAAMVRGFAEEGAKVAAFHRNETGERVLQALSAEAAPLVQFFRCDVSQKAEVDQAFAEAAAWLGGLDVMVNAAGIAPGAPSHEITVQDWDDVFAINARGTFLSNQAAFPLLRDAGGAIINFASAAGVNGQARKAHYSASKGAVLAWTRSIAMEWGEYGITVNAIAPGIWTPMYEKTRANMTPERLAQHDAEMARIIPLGGKLGDPDRDFLPYMIFLAGDGARFITGQTIKIDGGLMMLS
ncbi:SDR family NAD(P)-dependent oxidoreductase [Sphingobium phenoxybenzoativorans]|uniref:SDR family NAD(P)-dependent oxidoreductase n=1 Tax=Sphingobium phenoxybenzoativorans TaxID=1592790 RepID=UPI0008722A48|nr:SDR family NAD(P)-dependent oxidoreductase [Sphingobium phenoxybenzoativorans]